MFSILQNAHFLSSMIFHSSRLDWPPLSLLFQKYSFKWQKNQQVSGTDNKDAIFSQWPTWAREPPDLCCMLKSSAEIRRQFPPHYCYHNVGPPKSNENNLEKENKNLWKGCLLYLGKTCRNIQNQRISCNCYFGTNSNHVSKVDHV